MRQILALLFSVTACQYERPRDVQPTDAGGDGRSSCREQPEICVAPNATCVMDECRDCAVANDHEADDCDVAGMQVCGTSNSCRPCRSDDECNSAVCDGGVCLASANVIYVALSGSGTGECTQATPCSTLAQAVQRVSVARAHVVMEHGAYVATGATTIDARVTIHANEVVLERSTNGSILDILGGDVTFLGGTFRNATGTGSADGITCANGAALRLDSVTVDGNADRGIEVRDCTLQLTRVVISNNREGGLRLIDGSAVISNAFVLSNGNSNTLNAGGIYLVPSVGGSRIEFSTFRRNAATATAAGALGCAGWAADARNNLIFGSVNTPIEVQGTSCTHSYSIVGPLNAPPGIEIRSPTLAEVAFIDPNGNSAAASHLATTSVARAAADPASATSIDFDGDTRPNPAGSRADIGADEIP